MTLLSVQPPEKKLLSSNYFPGDDLRKVTTFHGPSLRMQVLYMGSYALKLSLFAGNLQKVKIVAKKTGVLRKI